MIQVLRDDLMEDPNFRSRQQTKEGPVSSAHFLYTYLLFIKCVSEALFHPLWFSHS